MSDPKPPKTISAETELMLFALYGMAASHYQKSREFEFAMSELLTGDPAYQGHLSDSIYKDDGRVTRADFERALKYEGVTVTKSKQRKRSRRSPPPTTP